MRQIFISEECERYLLDVSSERVKSKFKYILEVLDKQKIVHSSFVEKLIGTIYYELKIKAENQIRIIIFKIDHENFIECFSPLYHERANRRLQHM